MCTFAKRTDKKRRMTKALILSALTMLLTFSVNAQTTVLADFENGLTGKLKIGTDYSGELFKVAPKVMNNPDKTGINTSRKCVGATNVANAGWWKNFLILELRTPMTINDDNCFLSMIVAVFVNLSAAQRKLDLSMASGYAEKVRTYVTDRGRNLQLDTSLQNLHNMELPARSVVTVVISLEDATGIAAAPEQRKGHPVYDLQGRRVANPQKGIYIVGDRKLLLK